MKTAEQRLREQVIGKPYSDTLAVNWLGYRPVVERDSLIVVDIVYCGPVGGEGKRHQFADVVEGKIVNLGRGKDVAVIKRKPPETGSGSL